MSTGNPILNALERMEERLVERIEDRFRELRVDLDGRFDAVNRRLDRLRGLSRDRREGWTTGDAF